MLTTHGLFKPTRFRRANQIGRNAVKVYEDNILADLSTSQLDQACSFPMLPDAQADAREVFRDGVGWVGILALPTSTALKHETSRRPAWQISLAQTLGRLGARALRGKC